MAKESKDYSKADRDNSSNQQNENNDAYWQSRGHSSRPDDWEDRDSKTPPNEDDES